MKLTSAEKAERRTHFRQQLEQGVEPREAARTATERANNAATASMLMGALEKLPQPPDWYESPEERAVRTEMTNADKGMSATATGAREPLTPDHRETTVVVPHEFVRCGLFGVADPKSSRQHVPHAVFEVYGTNGGTITYCGPELRQDDRQVFFEALNFERSTPGSATATPNQFLVKLGWSRNTESRKKLHACIGRLQDAQLTIEVRRLGRLVIPSLLTHVDVLDDGSYRMKFHDSVRRLYDDNCYTCLRREYEQKLERRSDLARWLLLFYSTHQTPRPIPLATLIELCNDAPEKKYAFKDKLTAALGQLVRVKFLLGWNITRKVDGKSGTEMVEVKRPRMVRFEDQKQ
ncbi:hypothetical protein E1N52_27080 [Paraburkholderia guartelaensis]|uniref:TrfA family protein n=1 Tax=Paraburkholderia guartelaensis TaxID=2546446 RepID=A0A4R5L8H8_9BURK|nr:plasmid replication initiator TrfA [Paraburkholderia guartelaensis]TDG05101.1 hypothetical protein E1N52_27080 [Paraburkholderia guartelaensis]